MPITIALAGNPNSGKTSLFNAMTGSRQYVGNRPGVTVEQVSGPLLAHKGVLLVDLPGVYSLSPYSTEETVTRRFLTEQNPSAILQVADATCPERNLFFTLQLMELELPIVIAFNMIDLAKKRGDSFQLSKLSQMLGCEILPVSARTGSGLSQLGESAVRIARHNTKPNCPFRFSDKVEGVLSQIAALLPPTTLPKRWAAIKIFERDPLIQEVLKLPKETLTQIEPWIHACELAYDQDSVELLIHQRYEYVTMLVHVCIQRGTKKSSLPDIDRILTHRIFAIPSFLLLLCGIYTLSIRGPGGYLSDAIAGLIELVTETIKLALADWEVAPWLIGLLCQGMLQGIGSVLAFVPQLAILFFCLAWLEDCGYMARIAFILDGIFQKFGLSGKSVIPLLVASGCGVPGILSCRTIEGNANRRITLTVTTFVPCSAKLPIISLISASFFHGSALVAVSIYLVGILAVLLSGILLKKCGIFGSDDASFVMELPAYRLPRPGNLFRHVGTELSAFLEKVTTVLLPACSILWFLNYYTPTFTPAVGDNSLLAYLGKMLAPFFAPLGFGHLSGTVSTLSGLVAKENLVASLSILDGSLLPTQCFTPLSGYAFLLFNMLCSPCVAAMSAIHREMGNPKWTAFALAYQTGFAYLVTFLFYQLGLRILA